MIEFKRKEGWVIQPDDKKLNSILRAINRCEGHCPCQKEHPKCPCSSYLDNDKCCCNLYIHVK